MYIDFTDKLNCDELNSGLQVKSESYKVALSQLELTINERNEAISSLNNSYQDAQQQIKQLNGQVNRLILLGQVNRLILQGQAKVLILQGQVN